jgi:putative transposase
VLDHPRRDKPLTGVPDEVWEAARDRERVIRQLVLAPPVYGTRSEVMTTAAAELGLSPHHLYRLLKAYGADPRTRSLLPKTPGPQAGQRRLDPRNVSMTMRQARVQFRLGSSGFF